jgi:uncharacterized membrane protein
MDAKTPMVLAAAKYKTRDDAVADFHAVWAAKRGAGLDHVAAAVLTKDEQGELQVERHDSSAKEFAWGGALIGAALVLIAPPTGVAVLAAGTGAGAGAGGIVGHFWRNIPKDDVAEVSELLDSGESGLLVVAVNHRRADVTRLFSRAERSKIIETTAGDLDAEFDKAVKQAQSAKAATS